MHILLVYQYFKEVNIIGGSRFNEMAKVWVEKGHQVTVLAGNLDGQSQSSFKREEYKGKLVYKKHQNGITVFRCNVSESYSKSFFGRIKGYLSFVFSSTYAGLFKARDKYDVILVSSPPLFVGITAFVLSFFKRVPYVFEVRDLWPESAIDTGILKNKLIIKFAYWFEALIYRKAKRINVLTPAFKEKLIKNKGVTEDKLMMIPNAADFEMSDELLNTFDPQKFRQEKNWQDKFIITYVGAHGVANGLHQVLETAKLLTDTNVVFVLVGDGMKKKALIEKAEKENINNVWFYDSQPKKEVLKFVMASDMGTSVLLKNDTFKTVYSNKTFDYMSCKKPILMAIDGVSRALVETADAGAFVEPENPNDFEQKIRFYLFNKNLLKIQGDNGYHFAKQNFDRIKLAKDYLIELLSIVNK